jgi:hypothetical protein
LTGPRGWLRWPAGGSSPKRPDWRALSLLAALCGAWLFFALAPGLDKPRPAELIPAQPGGALERSIRKSEAAAAVRSGRLTLVEGAEAFRRIDQDAGAPAPDLDAYCGEVIRWVRGPDAGDKVRPDLGDLLEAELDELRQDGVRLPAGRTPRRRRGRGGRWGPSTGGGCCWG